MSSWCLTSWQDFPYRQSVHYNDTVALNNAIDKLKLMPPLVTSSEVNRLKNEIARAGRGETFLLQGGDCAESFNDCRAEVISNKLKILLQMSLILVHNLRKPVVRIGRIAGQYAKPRSNDFETINGITLPSYRGDLINSVAFTKEARQPNPELLLQAYSCSAMTLNFIRALIESGFADLHYPKLWDLSFIGHSAQKQEFKTIADSIEDSINLLKIIGAVNEHNTQKIDFYTSHEALHLHYEQALTREERGMWFNLSTHLPWIGIRTGQLDSAHVEFLRGVENPIGLKVGPNASPDWLVEVIAKLNPNNEEGKVVLFTRLGALNVEKILPSLVRTIQKAKLNVTWSCDPMHGNTETTADGVKTRRFETILHELKSTISVHRVLKSHLGGVHFELTGDHVTECTGGSHGLGIYDLKKAYHTLVDPRLNYEQSLEMALRLSDYYRQEQLNCNKAMSSRAEYEL